MSLPTSRNRTYVDGVTLGSAGDMNDIQDWIIDFYARTRGVRTRAIGAYEGVIKYTATLPGTDWLEQSDGSVACTNDGVRFYLPIPLQIGDRVLTVKVYVQDTDATHYVTCTLKKVAMATGTLTSKSTAVDSDHSGTKQEIALTGITPAAIADKEAWFIEVLSAGGNNGGNRFCWGAEITYDTP